MVSSPAEEIAHNEESKIKVINFNDFCNHYFPGKYFNFCC